MYHVEKVKNLQNSQILKVGIKENLDNMKRVIYFFRFY